MRWILPSVDGEVTEQYCVKSCQRTHGYSPACEACPRPVLYQINIEAFELFQACLTQFRYSMNGPTGLDYSAVKSVAEILDVELNKEMFSKILLMENEYLILIGKVQENG